MARSKHKTTGNGTHRERIANYREELQKLRAAQQEAMKQMRLQAQQATPSEMEAPAPWTTSGDTAEANAEPLVGADCAFPLPESETDGLGHALEDQSLSDTMRELKGMLNNDKHEQLMDTFVPAESAAT